MKRTGPGERHDVDLFDADLRVSAICATNAIPPAASGLIGASRAPF